jgi:glycosyltransferase involved in cell wall biosynthesis
VVLYVAVEAHFRKHGDAVYTEREFLYPYWREYLEIFEEVRPIGRVEHVPAPPAGWQRADGPGVRFCEVTEYRGFWSLLQNVFRVFGDCRRAVRDADALLLRWGFITIACWFWAWLLRKPYAVEFVGNTRAAINTVHEVRTLGLAPLIGAGAELLARRLAKMACCAAYVSQYIRSLYPKHDRQREWVFSGVQLHPGHFRAARPPEFFQHEPKHIVSVGRMEPDKGNTVLLDALVLLLKRGAALEARIAGPGRELEMLRQGAAERGAGRVEFLGHVEWGPALWELLDAADLFVLPSITEGMPRALIEAMARGLPAIGSNVGGIPELLTPEDVVPAADAAALAARIEEVLRDPQRLAAMSRRNLERARDYDPANMNQRKHAFWRYLIAEAERRRPGTTRVNRMPTQRGAKAITAE